MTEEQMAHNRRRALEIAAEYDGESGIAIRVDREMSMVHVVAHNGRGAHGCVMSFALDLSQLKEIKAVFAALPDG